MPFRHALLAATLTLAMAAPGVVGQTTQLRVDENLRAEPDGGVIGRLNAGTSVRIEGTQGSWSRITFEGVVWMPSLQIFREEGFDLIVSESGGENLRDEPAGRIAGRLMQGTRLEEVQRIAGWVRVRRTAWIWTPSLQGTAPPPSAPRPAPIPEPEVRPSVEATPPQGGGAAPDAPGAPWLSAGPRGAAILSSAGGDTLAAVRVGTEMRVLAREGNWARVQLEGWVWVPGAGASEATPESGIIRDVRAVELARDRDRYRGRVVELSLQFISLERAEPVRTDFFEGEPFLLTRSTEGERIFVYVAVPPERIRDVERLTPLERIRVVGRVRSGAASLTGSPILDLLEVRRER